jgi:signal transduction histidine kinase
MFRRAAHLHGSLDIRSNPGGTVIDLRIPAGADR